jgi:hypothetical protein
MMAEAEDEEDETASWAQSWRRMVTGDGNTRVRDYISDSIFSAKEADHVVNVWVACTNGSTMEFAVNMSDTIAMVKAKVHELSGIPAQEQRLYDSEQRILPSETTVRKIAELQNLGVSITVEAGPLGINIGPSDNPLFRVMCCKLVEGGSAHILSGESLLPEMVLTHVNEESTLRLPFNDIKARLKETRPVTLTFAKPEEAIPKWCAELQLLRVDSSALTMLTWAVRNDTRVRVTGSGMVASVVAQESSWNLVTTGTEMRKGSHYWEVQVN